MENSLEIFKESITEIDKNMVYVTDEAIECFSLIKDVIESIAFDLSTLSTGSLPFTPDNLKLPIQITESINSLEDFLKSANRNSSKKVNRVIDARNILIRFDKIKKLMNNPNTNEFFREDAIQFFIRVGNLYPEEQIREFIGLLDEEELQYILQIVEQERTLIEKPLTNSLIHILASQRMKQLKSKTLARTENER